jgi:hypothetical protein
MANVWRIRHWDEKQQVEPLHADRQAAGLPLLAVGNENLHMYLCSPVDDVVQPDDQGEPGSKP